MKYKIGDLITDERNGFVGEMGIVVGIGRERTHRYYSIYWITGHFAGKNSEEPCEYFDNVEQN
jgi:hypothetical protein